MMTKNPMVNPMTDMTFQTVCDKADAAVCAGGFGKPAGKKRLFAQVVTEVIVVAALINAVFGAVAAHAFDGQPQGKGARLGMDAIAMELAYAPPAPERFEAFQPFLDEMTFEDEGHPMNDALMGMSVTTADGKTAGYVTDAYVNEDGTIDEIVVTLGDEGATGFVQAVYVPSRYVLLGEMTVTVDMTLSVLVTQEPVISELASAE